VSRHADAHRHAGPALWGPGRDGPGPPHHGVRTVGLLGGCAFCLYLARFVPGFVELLLPAAAFSALPAAIFSLWNLGGGPPAEEP
jgi:hypothetical protein